MLRRRLGETAASVLEADAGALRLGPEVETDLATFEAELARGRVEAACALWRGPFCEVVDGQIGEATAATARSSLIEVLASSEAIGRSLYE